MNKLEEEIEHSRKKLLELAALYGLASEETITCSQYLDQLLNSFIVQKKLNS
ncbi:aspartyl-phosphate phosphatase Spo0E family protein [Heyndrickxia acidicola]|uniref:Aspartyl-phosphate phosphatase Spo0E family protein n=1 Tax=Heyndrickxia acidicola TaxID=209389 RepID=A0ABU6MMJ1_9BACI|nr:aspartyl-phosphate phosphatase Spo0E family protein [Heyndrickxia acidicola]MED1205730.1 aspartyl-phosphate phosphatase Spo0E family protein [Heyndrickxia acidicola]